MTKKTGQQPEKDREMARMAIERSALYRLLATVFREEPTEAFLRDLSDAGVSEALAAVGVDGASSLAPGDTFPEELAVEYSRLFAGPGPHVSPYESVHLGGEGGSLWGPETAAVKRFVEGSGFAYDTAYHDLPDHVSVELELMAHLTSTEAVAWRAGEPDEAANSRSYQKAFLDRHLGRWVERFSEQVAELAQLPFYREMAALARDFVTAERRELETTDAVAPRPFRSEDRNGS